MSSVVRFRFGSGTTTWSEIVFDNSSISVLDLKRAIVQKTKLDKSPDSFDLQLKDAQSGEEYKFDGTHIPKNSSIVVRRVPGKRSTFESIKLAPTIDIKAARADASAAVNAEDEAMERVMNAAVEPQPIAAPQQGFQFANQNASQRPLHPNYVCRRCNQKGHHISLCPNVDSVDANGRPVYAPHRLSALLPTFAHKQIEQPREASDPSMRHDGLQRSFSQTHPHFHCRLCKRRLQSAVTTPCCSVSCCDECLRQQLLSDDSGVCPFCGTSIDVGALQHNATLQATVDKFFSEQGVNMQSAPMPPALAPAPAPAPVPVQRPMHSQQQHGYVPHQHMQNQHNSNMPVMPPQGAPAQLAPPPIEASTSRHVSPSPVTTADVNGAAKPDEQRMPHMPTQSQPVHTQMPSQQPSQVYYQGHPQQQQQYAYQQHYRHPQQMMPHMMMMQNQSMMMTPNGMMYPPMHANAHYGYQQPQQQQPQQPGNADSMRPAAAAPGTKHRDDRDRRSHSHSRRESRHRHSRSRSRSRSPRRSHSSRRSRSPRQREVSNKNALPVVPEDSRPETVVADAPKEREVVMRKSERSRSRDRHRDSSKRHRSRSRDRSRDRSKERSKDRSSHRRSRSRSRDRDRDRRRERDHKPDLKSEHKSEYKSEHKDLHQREVTVAAASASAAPAPIASRVVRLIHIDDRFKPSLDDQSGEDSEPDRPNSRGRRNRRSKKHVQK